MACACGSNEGRLLGIELVGTVIAGVLALSLVVRSVAVGRLRGWLLGAGVLAAAVALGTTKFPTEVPEDWGRDSRCARSSPGSSARRSPWRPC